MVHKLFLSIICDKPVDFHCCFCGGNDPNVGDDRLLDALNRYARAAGQKIIRSFGIWDVYPVLALFHSSITDVVRTVVVSECLAQPQSTRLNASTPHRTLPVLTICPRYIFRREQIYPGIKSNTAGKRP